MIRITDVIMIMVGVWLALFPITIVLFISGIIEINFNYLDELQECENVNKVLYFHSFLFLLE